MAKARVRGIYSTALTKLLLDHEFTIVQPSTTVRERFGLEELDESPDLDVYDRLDRQGVQAFGRAGFINRFCSILKSRLDDVIVRRWAVTVDGIYKGLIKGIDPETHSVMIDVGSAVGRITDKEVPDPDLRHIVVQVDRRRVGAKKPVLGTRIKIPGRYAILIPKREVKISRRIRDPQIRSRLRKLGEELISSEWGILWRTAAADQSSGVLKKEIANLTREGRAVMDRAEGAGAPATLWAGGSFVNVEFPALSKKQLDDVRRSVAPTMDGHHYYKACGERVSSALDMAEKLMERGCSLKEVEDLFKQTVEAEFPVVGSVIGMEHVKLDGAVFHLGEALVEAFGRDQSLLRLSRVFERKGVYDGLGTSKEPGDCAVTEAKVGEWHFKTEYFSRDGRYKGTYINLNTPIELYPHGIRYVDLEVDVCVWPNGTVRRLDEEKLEKAAEEGLVTGKLVKIVKEKLQELIAIYQSLGK